MTAAQLIEKMLTTYERASVSDEIAAALYNLAQQARVAVMSVESDARAKQREIDAWIAEQYRGTTPMAIARAIREAKP